MTLVSVLACLLLVGYALVCLLRERSSANWAFLFAVVVTAVIDLAELRSMRNDEFAIRQRTQIVEGLLAFAWLLASLLHARAGGWREVRIGQRLLLFCSLLPFLCVLFTPSRFHFYSPDFAAEHVLFLPTAGLFLYGSIMALLVISLANLEITLGATNPEQFWRLKFETVGIGMVIVAQVLYYSQAVLFRTIDMDWTKGRSIVLLLAAMLLFAGGVRKGQGVKLQVSRQVAFNSMVFAAVGIYLVLVGLLGEGLRYFGVPFQNVLIVAVAVAAGVALLLLFLSAKLRRNLKVLLHKNFYQNKYDYRVQWLEFSQRLARPQSSIELQQVIISAYCEIFGLKGGALFLFDQELAMYHNVTTYEMEPTAEQFSPESPLVRYLVEQQRVFSYRDDNPALVAAHGSFLSAYGVSFIVPLFHAENVEGFIVLGAPISDLEQYIYEDYDLMKTIARQASVSIVNQRLAEQVARLREMEAIGNISTFVIHDLKNYVAALSLLLENAADYIDNPEFQQDMLKSLGNTVGKMQHLISRLKNLGEKELLNLLPVDLFHLSTQTVPLVSGADVQIIGTTVLVNGDAEELQKVLLNFLINAIEASVERLPIIIETGAVPQPFFRVIDHGSGMTQEFQQRDLFKPFVTTKKQGLGIGLYQCRRIIEAHGGRIDVSSHEGQGTTFTVFLPEVA